MYIFRNNRGMRDVVLITGIRTPFAKAGKGSFRDTRSDDLGIAVVKHLVEQAQFKPQEIEDVVLGCAMPEAEQGMNVARPIVLGSGLSVDVPAMTINRFCASGVQSISIVADRIATGQMEVGLAGGVESMSLIPMAGNKPSLNPTIVEKQPEVYTPMGVTAENVARRFGISRQQQDEFALQSHLRAVKAQQAGFFAEEILPITTFVYEQSGPKQVTLQMDENPRADTDLVKLASLKPAFDPTGSVTAGNSSPLTDGAAAVVLASADYARSQKKPILGYFRHFVVAGVPPEIMGVGPVFAIRKLLQKTGLSMDQIDLFEINEAFASQAVYCAKELNVPMEKLNVNGGAIALGHPLGVTGTRLALTILRELKRRKGKYGIVSMCVGGGMGAAALLETA